MTSSRGDDAFVEGLRIGAEIFDLMNSGPLQAEMRGTPDEEAVGGVQVRQPYRYVLSMYARARSYYRSILRLLRHYSADEAMALGRSLLEDSLRLDLLQVMPDERSRVDAIIGWALDGTSRSIGLYHSANKAGLGDGQDDAIAALEEQRKDLIAFRAEQGSGRRTRDFFSEQDLENRAFETGREESWWMHEVGDHMVHGNLSSHTMRNVDSDAGPGVGLDLVGHPSALLDIVAYASESAVVSHRGICTLLGLDYDEELDRALTRIESLQAEALRQADPLAPRPGEEGNSQHSAT